MECSSSTFRGKKISHAKDSNFKVYIETEISRKHSYFELKAAAKFQLKRKSLTGKSHSHS